MHDIWLFYGLYDVIKTSTKTEVLYPILIRTYKFTRIEISMIYKLKPKPEIPTIIRTSNPS